MFLHFPPYFKGYICDEIILQLYRFGVERCYFGHIHGMYNAPKEFEFEGISMRLVSSDAMDFTLYRLPDTRS